VISAGTEGLLERGVIATGRPRSGLPPLFLAQPDLPEHFTTGNSSSLPNARRCRSSTSLAVARRQHSIALKGAQISGLLAVSTPEWRARIRFCRGAAGKRDHGKQ